MGNLIKMSVAVRGSDITPYPLGSYEFLFDTYYAQGELYSYFEVTNQYFTAPLNLSLTLYIGNAT